MLYLCTLPLLVVSYNNINHREMQTRNDAFTPHHHVMHIST